MGIILIYKRPVGMRLLSLPETDRVDYEKLSGDRVGSRVNQYAHESKSRNMQLACVSKIEVSDIVCNANMRVRKSG